MRWLLLLGAEARYDRLDAAVQALERLGTVDELASERLTDAAGGGPERYRNRLVGLQYDGSRADLTAACKRIERELGRGQLDGMPIDIDLLASFDGAQWHADPHAVGKREFDTPHVRLLLADARLLRVLADC